MKAPPVTGLRRGAVLLRVALAVFVAVWLLGPPELRSTVPVWLAFAIALGLELQFFLGAARSTGAAERRSLRLPQAVDRERYGYEVDADELLLVREGDQELWIPYAGETDEELDELIAAAHARAGAGEQPAGSSRERPLTRPARPYGGLLWGLAVIAVLGALAWIADSRAGWGGLGSSSTRTASRESAEGLRT